VWVEHDRDAVRAREIIETLLKVSAHGPPRKCAECGEESPSTFETCWNCGHSLD
jgi:hypothetical protein